MPETNPPEDDILPTFAYAVLGVIVFLFAITNLPWGLGDIAQARQAFLSYQMVENGDWLVQHTPAGAVIAQPPLQGWLSAMVYLGLGGHFWQFAWRLPAFVGALLILGALWRTGEKLFGNNLGAVLATAAFGLNLFVPAMATRVSSDMVLAALLFFAGLLILKRLNTGKAWERNDGISMSLLLLGATFTAGPLAYGFLVPGLIAFHFFARKMPGEHHVWDGFLWWLLPLAVFALWVFAGSRVPGFQEQLARELLGHFGAVGSPDSTASLGSRAGDLLLRMLPWLLLLAGIFLTKKVRAACATDASLLWLVCWSLGSIGWAALASAKGAEFFLPALPPICLLLAAAARHTPKYKVVGQPLGRIAILGSILTILATMGHSAWRVSAAARDGRQAVIAFADRVRDRVADHRDRLAVIDDCDAGMLIYTRALRLTDMQSALEEWRRKEIDWLVLGSRTLSQNRAALEPFDIVTETAPLPDSPLAYHLLYRISPETAPENPATPEPATEAEKTREGEQTLARVEELEKMALAKRQRAQAAEKTHEARAQLQFFKRKAWTDVIQANRPAFEALRQKAVQSPDKKVPCTICDAKGVLDLCVVCDHTGKCPTCGGTGKVFDEVCPTCVGSGKCFLCFGLGKMPCPYCQSLPRMKEVITPETPDPPADIPIN